MSSAKAARSMKCVERKRNCKCGSKHRDEGERNKDKVTYGLRSRCFLSRLPFYLKLA